MSRFLKGCYMDLLHAQFNHGRLSLEEIKTVLGSDFGQAWPTLQKKFAVDEAEKYFNERLDEEIEKRRNYTDSRKANGSKGGRPKKPYAKPYGKPTTNLPEDEDEISTKKKAFLENEIWREQFAMANKISVDTVRKMQEKFVKDCDLRGDPVKSYQKFFLFSWEKGLVKLVGNEKNKNSYV